MAFFKYINRNVLDPSNRMDFHKSDARTISLVLLGFSLVMGGVLSNEASAQEQGMSLNVVASEGSSTLSISGQTVLPNDVTIVVTAPDGNNKVFIGQKTPSDGKYMIDVDAEGILKQDGWYIVSARQGNSLIYQMQVPVEAAGGSFMETLASDSSLDFGSDPILIPTDNIGGLVFTVDAPEGGLTIGIDGNTDRLDRPVVLVVTAPNGNRIEVGQVTPDQDGSFSTDIIVGCPGSGPGSGWEQDGFYTITAQQGESSLYKESMDVDIRDCVIVPEFGTIAVLVLAVAIVSIIAVTSRSRLGIMPRL